MRKNFTPEQMVHYAGMEGLARLGQLNKIDSATWV